MFIICYLQDDFIFSDYVSDYERLYGCNTEVCPLKFKQRFAVVLFIYQLLPSGNMSVLWRLSEVQSTRSLSFPSRIFEKDPS